MSAGPLDACSLDGGCITCGDVAVPLTAVEAGQTDARCRDDEGRTELVALEIVGPLQVGDRVLVHAGVALERLKSPALATMDDAALLAVGGARMAMTTDAFVVSPLRFPGGSIGELAVNGTVNDLAVSGARPLGLSAA